MPRLATLAAALTLAACGSNSGGGGAGADGGGSAGPDASIGGTGVSCGNTTCLSGEQCCFESSDGGINATCATACQTGGLGVATCSGAADCPGGACCATVSTAAGAPPACPLVTASATCQPLCASTIPLTCPGDAALNLCRTRADCANDPSGFTECCTISQGGLTFQACLSPNLVVFAGSCLP
jgi:hypothetical protein